MRPPDPQDSPITTLPINLDAPLDWWAYRYFNEELTLKERWAIVRNGIKITLPLEEFCAPAYWHLWMHLSYKEFLEKFSYHVWDQYNIPTEEEVARLERAEWYGRTSEDVESVYSYDEEEMEKFLEEDGEDVDSEAEYQPSKGSEADQGVIDLTIADRRYPDGRGLQQG